MNRLLKFTKVMTMGVLLAGFLFFTTFCYLPGSVCLFFIRIPLCKLNLDLTVTVRLIAGVVVL